MSLKNIFGGSDVNGQLDKLAGHLEKKIEKQRRKHPDEPLCFEIKGMTLDGKASALSGYKRIDEICRQQNIRISVSKWHWPEKQPLFPSAPSGLYITPMYDPAAPCGIVITLNKPYEETAAEKKARADALRWLGVKRPSGQPIRV